MAARGSRSLVLDVSADITKLASASKVARSAMLQIQQTGVSVEAAVRQSMSDLMPIGSVQAQAREMDKIIRSVQANARAVIAEGNTTGGLQLFDVGAADEQVRVMTANAGTLRQWSAAAEAASLAGGEFGERQRQISAALLTEAMQLETQAKALDETASSFRAIQSQMGGYNNAQRKSAQMTGETRAGLQQLSYQLNDAAVMWNMGASATQVFVSQIGQVTQAVQLMSGGTSKWAAFLGGPWGMALATGVAVLAPFVAKLFEAEKAADDVRFATSAFGDAQSILGSVIDLTTGKIKNQSAAMWELARAQAAQGQIAARQQMADGRKEMAGIQKYSLGIGAGFGGGISPYRYRSNAADILSAYQDGSVNSTEAGRGLKSMLDTGLINEKEYLTSSKALTDVEMGRANLKVFEELEDALNGDRGATGQFLTPNKPERPRKDNSAQEALQRERSYEDAVTGAEQGVLGAMLARASTEEERLGLQLQMLAGDKTARQRDLQRQVTDGELTQAQADQLAAIEERTRGLEEEGLRADQRQRLLDQTLAIQRQVHGQKISELQHEYDFAAILDDRREIAKDMLEWELTARQRAAERMMASEDPLQQELGRNELDDIKLERERGNERIDREHETPIQRYLRSLEEAAADTNTAYSAIAADGLQNLEDGLLGVIMGTESVGSAFKKMASQIIADLARIAIQKAILSAATKVLGFSDGGQVNLLDATGYAGGGHIMGPGTGTSDSIPAWLSDGEFVVRQAVVSRPGVLPFLEDLNRGKLPGFANGGLVSASTPRLAQLPRPEQLARDGGQRLDRLQLDARVQVNAGPMFEAKMEEVSARTVGAAAEPIVSAAESRTRRGLQRPRLPGGFG